MFSLRDSEEIRGLLQAAGFDNIEVKSDMKSLRVPPPKDFMWQYIHATPLTGVLEHVDDDRRAALERDVCSGWEKYVENGSLKLEVRMTAAVATK